MTAAQAVIAANAPTREIDARLIDLRPLRRP